MSHDPLEPITSAPETLTGWAHLSQTALPMLGRVGTIVGGIFSLLAVFRSISGEIVTTIEGFVLVVAAVASGIVVFYRSAIIVDNVKRSVYLYPHKARVVASIVLTISTVLLIYFVLRFFIPGLPGANAPAGAPPRQSPPAGGTPRNPDRATSKPGGAPNSPVPTLASTVIPSTSPTTIPSTTPPAIPSIAPTAIASFTPSPTAPPSPLPSATATFTPAPSRTATPSTIDQITDVNQLLKLGSDALNTKKYTLAQSIFTRATFIEATNAQAQYGLGQAYFYQNNLNQANEPFQITLRLNPNLYAAHAYLGWIYDYRQDKAKAIAEYDVFLKAAPRDDPWRADITERERQISSSTPAPTLTPIGGTPFQNPPPRPSQTATPTLTSTNK